MKKWFKKQPIEIKTTIISSVIAGIIAITIAIFTGAIPKIIDHIFDPQDENGLQLVDLTFSDNESNNRPTLDVKLRNNGEMVAFLKRVDFNVRDVFIVPTIPIRTISYPDISSSYGDGKEGSAVDVSSIYEREFPIIDNLPYNVSLNIAQEIKPNDTDRFQIVLGPEITENVTSIIIDFILGPELSQYNKSIIDGNVTVPKFSEFMNIMNKMSLPEDGIVFVTDIEFIYDEDDKNLTGQTLIFEYYQADNIFSSVVNISQHPEEYPVYDLTKEHYLSYKQLAQEIDGIEGLKTECLNDAIQDVLINLVIPK